MGNASDGDSSDKVDLSAIFRRIFRQRGIASQGNIHELPTQSRARSHLGRDFQAGTAHQVYGLAHENLILLLPLARDLMSGFQTGLSARRMAISTHL